LAAKRLKITASILLDALDQHARHCLEISHVADIGGDGRKMPPHFADQLGLLAKRPSRAPEALSDPARRSSRATCRLVPEVGPKGKVDWIASLRSQ
jgi:hypothetical protein